MSARFVEVKVDLDPSIREQFPDGLTVVGHLVTDQLAITPQFTNAPRFSGRWQVTHIPTGRRLGSPGGTCIACATRAAAVATSSGVDWTKSMDELRADENARKVRHAINAIQLECANGGTCTEEER